MVYVWPPMFTDPRWFWNKYRAEQVVERVELSTPFEGGLYLHLYGGTDKILSAGYFMTPDVHAPKIVLEYGAQRTVWANWAITEPKHLVSNSRCKIFMHFDRSLSGRSRLSEFRIQKKRRSKKDCWHHWRTVSCKLRLYNWNGQSYVLPFQRLPRHDAWRPAFTDWRDFFKVSCSTVHSWCQLKVNHYKFCCLVV